MSDKTILVLDTGIFKHDTVLDAALKELPNSTRIELINTPDMTSSDWDKIMMEILSADQIVTI